FTAGLRVLRFAGVLVSAARLVPVARFVPADDSDSAVTAVSSVVVSAVLEEVTEFLLPAERLAGLRHTRVISHLGVALGSGPCPRIIGFAAHEGTVPSSSSSITRCGSTYSHGAGRSANSTVSGRP